MGLLSLTLGHGLESLGLGLLFDNLVILDAGQELITALGVLDMLNAEVDALLNNTVTNTLVYSDTNGVGSDIVDNTSLAMVELVGHALLYSTVALNIDDVADLVALKIGRKMLGTIVAELASEQVARTSANTVSASHFVSKQAQLESPM